MRVQFSFYGNAEKSRRYVLSCSFFRASRNYARIMARQRSLSTALPAPFASLPVLTVSLR